MMLVIKNSLRFLSTNLSKGSLNLSNLSKEDLRISVIKKANQYTYYDQKNILIYLSQNNHLSIIHDFELEVLKSLGSFNHETIAKHLYLFGNTKGASPEFLSVLSDTYLEKSLNSSILKKSMCLKIAVENTKKLNEYSGKVMETIRNFKYTELDYPMIISIARYIKNDNFLDEVADKFQGFMDRMNLKTLIFSAFHLSKEKKLSNEALFKIAERLKTLDFPEKMLFTRCLLIFTSHFIEFEFLNKKFYDYLSQNIEDLDARIKLNVLNAILMNKYYLYEPTCKLLYTSFCNTNHKLNPLDYSSMVHSFYKLDYDLSPFFGYCTDDFVKQLNGTQLCIIYHSLRLTAPKAILRLIKKYLMDKSGTANAKNILNFLKDLSEDEDFDQQYWNDFSSKAFEIINEYKDMTKEEFITQYTAILVNTNNKIKSS